MSDPIEDANDTVGVGGQNSNDNTITTAQGDANATTMVEQNNNTTTAVTATTSSSREERNPTKESVGGIQISGEEEARNGYFRDLAYKADAHVANVLNRNDEALKFSESMKKFEDHLQCKRFELHTNDFEIDSAMQVLLNQNAEDGIEDAIKSLREKIGQWYHYCKTARPCPDCRILTLNEYVCADCYRFMHADCSPNLTNGQIRV